jgi:hypothetical protein
VALAVRHVLWEKILAQALYRKIETLHQRPSHPGPQTHLVSARLISYERSLRRRTQSGGTSEPEKTTNQHNCGNCPNDLSSMEGLPRHVPLPGRVRVSRRRLMHATHVYPSPEAVSVQILLIMKRPEPLFLLSPLPVFEGRLTEDVPIASRNT